VLTGFIALAWGWLAVESNGTTSLRLGGMFFIPNQLVIPQKISVLLYFQFCMFNSAVQIEYLNAVFV
jgi:hypothetical protein